MKKLLLLISVIPFPEVISVNHKTVLCSGFSLLSNLLFVNIDSRGIKGLFGSTFFQNARV